MFWALFAGVLMVLSMLLKGTFNVGYRDSCGRGSVLSVAFLLVCYVFFLCAPQLGHLLSLVLYFVSQ